MNVRLVVKYPSRRERMHKVYQGLVFKDDTGTLSPVYIQTRRNKQSKWETVEVVHDRNNEEEV